MREKASGKNLISNSCVTNKTVELTVLSGAHSILEKVVGFFFLRRICFATLTAIIIAVHFSVLGDLENEETTRLGEHSRG